MDSLRGGPATAQIRAGLHRFRCGYRCFPLDCWPNLRENAFQILQRGLWTNSWSRGLRSLCRRSLGTYWGEKWRGGLQCRQCSLVFDPFSLDDRINKISRNVAQRFYSAAGPPDFYFGHHGFCASPEVQAGIVRGKITDSGSDFAELAQFPGFHRDPRPNCHLVTFCSDQLEQHPMVTVPTLIQQQRGWTAHVHHHDVDIAVIIYVSKRRPPPAFRRNIRECARDILERAVAIIAE